MRDADASPPWPQARETCAPSAGFGEVADRVAGAVAGRGELGRDHDVGAAPLRLRRRVGDHGEVGGDVAGLRHHLEGGEAHQFSLDAQAPSSRGRSPKRATSPKTSAAKATKTTVTAAMVGV